MDIKILVATYKKYWMPKEKIYLPIHVEKKGKNDLGYISLCRYRRYFAHRLKSSKLNDKKQAILTKVDYEQLLKKYDVILPKKRNYYIETVCSQYEHAHNKQDLDEV